jgi:hypothetical protein
MSMSQARWTVRAVSGGHYLLSRCCRRLKFSLTGERWFVIDGPALGFSNNQRIRGNGEHNIIYV